MVVDSSGHVWISSFDASGILLLDGSNWRWILTGASVESHIASMTLADDKIWIAARYTDGGDLAIIDTRSFGSQLLKFSDRVHSPVPLNLFSLNELPDATLGALTTNANGVAIFRLQANGQWQRYTSANPSSDHLASTLTMDRTGNIWLAADYYCVNSADPKMQRIFFQISPGGSTLTQPKEFHLECSGLPERSVRDSNVDQLNRLWIYSDDALNVFQIEVSGSLTPLKTYSSYNSSYQISDLFPSTSIPITSDGVIWSIGDHGISTFDTSHADLPPTFPNWLASLVSDRSKRIGILLGAVFVNLAIMFLTQRYVTWHYKSTPKSLTLNPA